MIIRLLVMRPWYTIFSQNVEDKILASKNARSLCIAKRLRTVKQILCVIFFGKKGTLLQIPVPNDKTVTCNSINVYL